MFAKLSSHFMFIAIWNFPSRRYDIQFLVYIKITFFDVIIFISTCIKITSEILSSHSVQIIFSQMN